MNAIGTVLEFDHDTEELKDHPGVLGLYQSRARFKKNGRGWTAFCPNHSDRDTRSLTLNQKDGRLLWHCFGACQRGGSIVDFVMACDRLQEGAAIQTVKRELKEAGVACKPGTLEGRDDYEKQKAFITIPLTEYAVVERNLATNRAAQDWLLTRGLTYTVATKLHVGFRQTIKSNDETIQDILDKGWLCFPYIHNDTVLLIKYRSLHRKAFSRKYGMETVLFNTETIDILEDVYLVAGELDAMTLEQAGFHSVSLPSDSTTITPEMKTKLELAGRLILAGDSDESGCRAMDKIHEKIPEALRLRWPVKDANQLWLKQDCDIEGFRKFVIELTDAAAKTPVSAVETTENDEDETENIPVCPPEIIEGDYIGDLTRILTDGTPIPPEYVRENLKTILGAMIDGEVGFPGHSDIHLRQYNINVSLHPRTGKGESWKRTGESPSGVLAGLLSESSVQVIDGSLFGSGEYMIKKLAQCAANVQESNPAARVDVLARFDEMAEPFEKAKATGSILESKLLQLYERNSSSQGSFKNGEHEVHGLHFSLSGDFTRDGFERAFAGRGSGASGFLARCVYSYAKRTQHEGDWVGMDMAPRMKTFVKIVDCVNALQHSEPQTHQAELFGEADEPLIGHRFIPEETDGARKMRLDFFRQLSHQDPRYTPELEAHFKRDILFRTIFSDKVIDERKTEKAIVWTRHQLESRKLLWPEEAGGPAEQFERKILKALADKNLSRTQLGKYCHVNRAGSGGREFFNRAIRALLTNDIQTVGKTQRGVLLYALSSRLNSGATREPLGSHG
jgi:hypothetical protein